MSSRYFSKPKFPWHVIGCIAWLITICLGSVIWILTLTSFNAAKFAEDVFDIFDYRDWEQHNFKDTK